MSSVTNRCDQAQKRYVKLEIICDMPAAIIWTLGKVGNHVELENFARL